MTTKSVRALFALAATAIALTNSATAAEQKLALSDLARSEGVWKTEFSDDQGNERIGYSYRWINEPFQVMRQLYVAVDKSSKKVVDQSAGFINLDPSQQVFQGLYFSGHSWVGESSMVPTEKGYVIQVSVTGTNRSRFHVTVHEEYESDTALTATWKGMLYGGRYVDQGLVRQFRKVNQTMRELVDKGEIVFPEVAEPIEALAPLRRLVGRWESVDGSGTLSHQLSWELRLENKWLIERWRIGGESGSGGFNVTGIDPATGMLTLWSISSGFMGKSGRWDVISDTVLGQVQGNSRLIREFPDANTFKAHWQVLQAGTFVDVPETQAQRYTARRVSRRQADNPSIPLQERLKQARKPYAWAAIDYMVVPTGGDAEYVEVENEWRKIHEELARQGKLKTWILWKVENPQQAGFNYVTVKYFDSLSDAQSVYDFNQIAEFYGQEKLQTLFDRTTAARTLTRGEVWELVDYTPILSHTGRLNRVRVSLMKAANGKAADYENAERNFFSKFWQGVADRSPRFAAWQFARLHSFSGDRPAYDYFTAHILNVDAPEPGNEEMASIRQEAQRAAGDRPERPPINELREMLTTVNFDKVLEVSPEANPLVSEWRLLEGNWKASAPGGGYRIKRIRPGWEDLEVYDSEGNLSYTGHYPMRVEVRDGLNYFYVYHENRTYHSIYKVQGDVWYEQFQGIFRQGRGKPNDFFVYTRLENNSANR